MGADRRGDEQRAGYPDPVSGSTEPDELDGVPEDSDSVSDVAAGAAPEDDADEPKKKHGALREFAILISIALVLYYVMLTFVARPYLIPSE